MFDRNDLDEVMRLDQLRSELEEKEDWEMWAEGTPWLKLPDIEIKPLPPLQFTLTGLGLRNQKTESSAYVFLDAFNRHGGEDDDLYGEPHWIVCIPNPRIDVYYPMSEVDVMTSFLKNYLGVKPKRKFFRRRGRREE